MNEKVVIVIDGEEFIVRFREERIFNSITLYKKLKPFFIFPRWEMVMSEALEIVCCEAVADGLDDNADDFLYKVAEYFARKKIEQKKRNLARKALANRQLDYIRSLTK